MQNALRISALRSALRLLPGFAAVFAVAAAPARAAEAQSPLHVAARHAGPDGGWDFVTFDPARKRVYVARPDGVTALDVATGTVTGHLVDGARTHVALPINDGADILVTNGGDGTVFIADAMSGKIRVGGIKVGSKPDAAFVEPTTGLVWVMDNRGGGVSIVDPKAGAVVGAIAVPGALESPVSDGAGRVFVTVEDLGEIVVFDVDKRAPLAHWKLAECDEPTGLAYDGASGRLVAECANGTARIVSAKDGVEIARVTIGKRPDALIYDARRKLVYAPTGADGVVSVIDPARAAVVGEAPGQIGTRSGALDPDSGTLYLAGAKFGPPATEGGRPAFVPGSFEIIALAR